MRIRELIDMAAMAVLSSRRRLAVVDRVLDSFIGQPEALLSHVHPKHPGQSDRWPASALARRIVRLDRRLQFRPGRDRLNLGQKAIAPCLAPFGRVLQLGKARLHARHPCDGSASIVLQVTHRVSRGAGNKSVFP